MSPRGVHKKTAFAGNLITFLVSGSRSFIITAISIHDVLNCSSLSCFRVHFLLESYFRVQVLMNSHAPHHLCLMKAIRIPRECSYSHDGLHRSSAFVNTRADSLSFHKRLGRKKGFASTPNNQQKGNSTCRTMGNCIMPLSPRNSLKAPRQRSALK
jgi:hypothetical protein